MTTHSTGCFLSLLQKKGSAKFDVKSWNPDWEIPNEEDFFWLDSARNFDRWGDDDGLKKLVQDQETAMMRIRRRRD